MAQLRLYSLVFCLLAAGVGSQAQSIGNSTWKAYFLPINDSVRLRFTADSMLVRTDSGVTLLRSGYKDSAGIVTLEDQDGANACPYLPGTYRPRVVADTLIMILENDHCDTRSSTLMAKRWIRVPEAVKPKAAPKKKKGKG